MQLTAAAYVVAAKSRNDNASVSADVDQIVTAVREAAPARTSERDGWTRHLLWVDDRPDNNIYERGAFEAVGLKSTLALSTDEALDLLKSRKYAAIISDMGRREGPREGYVLLDAIRSRKDQTPFFIYSGSNAPEHKREAESHGGQGCTNDARELFEMVTRSAIDRASQRA